MGSVFAYLPVFVIFVCNVRAWTPRTLGARAGRMQVGSLVHAPPDGEQEAAGVEADAGLGVVHVRRVPPRRRLARVAGFVAADFP